MTQRPVVTGFYDKPTGTVSYVASCPATRRAAIIDPVLGFEPESGRASTAPADALIEHIDREGLKLDYVLETHVHADHLTAMAHVRKTRRRPARHRRPRRGGAAPLCPRFQRRAGIRPRRAAVRRTFRRRRRIQARRGERAGHRNAGAYAGVRDLPDWRRRLHRRYAVHARRRIGALRFPGGDAEELWRSVQRLYALPGETRVFVCHDYPPAGREPRWETSMDDERRDNMHLSAGTTLEEFVARRRARDATLSMPRLILPSLQVNMRAGVLPAAGRQCDPLFAAANERALSRVRQRYAPPPRGRVRDFT